MTDNTAHLQSLIDRRNEIVAEVDMLRSTAEQLVAEIATIDHQIIRVDSLRE
jgi:hypothetical protein